mmetsp:Transcript_29218/g.86505  ORF Transcript_29218/g.86505 Transcript_29218/m.86505 type:complete len:217 (+) Transcript_29218:44-694(+)
MLSASFNCRQMSFSVLSFPSSAEVIRRSAPTTATLPPFRTPSQRSLLRANHSKYRTLCSGVKMSRRAAWFRWPAEWLWYMTAVFNFDTMDVATSASPRSFDNCFFSKHLWCACNHLSSWSTLRPISYANNGQKCDGLSTEHVRFFFSPPVLTAFMALLCEPDSSSPICFELMRPELVLVLFPRSSFPAKKKEESLVVSQSKYLRKNVRSIIRRALY